MKLTCKVVLLKRSELRGSHRPSSGGGRCGAAPPRCAPRPRGSRALVNKHIVRCGWSEGTLAPCQPISISRRFAIFLSVLRMMAEGFRMPCRFSCRLARTGAAPGCLTLIFFPALTFTLPKSFVFREVVAEAGCTAGSLGGSSTDIMPCACANFAAARARFCSRFSSSSRSRAMSTASVTRLRCTLEFYARAHGKRTQVPTAARARPRVLTLPMLRRSSLVHACTRACLARSSCETSVRRQE